MWITLTAWSFFVVLLVLRYFRDEYSPVGVIRLWCFLFLVAAIQLLLLLLIPLHAARLAQLLSVGWCGVELVGFYLSRNEIVLGRFRSKFGFVLLFAVGFIFIRGLFPTFDVDSVQYHLAGLKWMSQRHTFIPLQHSPSWPSLWYYWLAFEEYLSIPGITLDLALYGSLVSTVLKVLSMLSVDSIIRRSGTMLRVTAIFLILVDDHFFFSSQNRFVYLNPSLIGLSALGFYFGFRVFRGKLSDSIYALAAIFCLSAVKYHGMIMGFIIVGLILYRVVLVFVQGECKSKLVKVFTNSDSYKLVGSALFALVLFGSHLIGEHTPFPPFDFGVLKWINPYRDKFYLVNYIGKRDFFGVILSIFSRVIYPGNLAMKAVAVLMIPTVVLSLLPRRRPKVSKRHIMFVIYCFALTFLWVAISAWMNPGESRYPRYIFGVSVVGLIHFVFILRRLSIVQYLSRPVFQITGACLLLLWLVVTIDTRYFNVPAAYRPSWKNLTEYWKYNGMQSENPSNRHMSGLYMPFVHTEMPPLERCLTNLFGRSTGRMQRAESVIIFGPYTVWPSLVLGYASNQGSLAEGGGFVHLGGEKSLKELGLEYAILPRSLPLPHARGPVIISDSSGSKLEPRFGREVCGSELFKVVEVL